MGWYLYCVNLGLQPWRCRQYVSAKRWHRNYTAPEPKTTSISYSPPRKPKILHVYRFCSRFHMFQCPSLLPRLLQTQDPAYSTTSWHATFLRWQDEQFVFENLYFKFLRWSKRPLLAVAGEESDSFNVWAVMKHYRALPDWDSKFCWIGEGGATWLARQNIEVTVRLG
jgi:hypothetical protein